MIVWCVGHVNMSRPPTQKRPAASADLSRRRTFLGAVSFRCRDFHRRNQWLSPSPDEFAWLTAHKCQRTHRRSLPRTRPFRGAIMRHYVAAVPAFLLVALV